MSHFLGWANMQYYASEVGRKFLLSLPRILMAFPGPCIVPWFLPQNMPQCITWWIWKARYGGSLSDDGCPYHVTRLQVSNRFRCAKWLWFYLKVFLHLILRFFFFNIQHAILKTSKPKQNRMKQLLWMLLPFERSSLGVISNPIRWMSCKLRC